MNFEYAEMISGGGLIYMSGGDPQHLAKSLVGTPAGDAIFQAWQEGASVAGCSAGAMALGATVPHALQFRRSETAGLGIAGSIHVLPHYDKYFGWAGDRVLRFVAQFGDNDSVVGVDEETALYRISDSWQVFGNGEVHTLSEQPVRRLRAGESL
jgi:cyanophycinase-like exopeptidase